MTTSAEYEAEIARLHRALGEQTEMVRRWRNRARNSQRKATARLRALDKARQLEADLADTVLALIRDAAQVNAPLTSLDEVMDRLGITDEDLAGIEEGLGIRRAQRPAKAPRPSGGAAGSTPAPSANEGTS